MDEIKFDLGKNIHITAKESGAPRFGVESHWGLKIYELVDLAPDIVVRYAREGYEIEMKSLFSVTMYADAENNNDLALERVEFMYSPRAGKSHQQARALVDDLIRQFTKGQWKRRIRDTCPAVAGRSSYLNEHGKVDGSCPLDPAFQIPMQDWLPLMAMTQRYEWLGDGVIAELIIHYREDTDGVTYSIDVEFQDFAIENRRYAAQEASELAEGDKKGWNSTANHKKDLAKALLEVKRLEDNAVKRGDVLVSRN